MPTIKAQPQQRVKPQVTEGGFQIPIGAFQAEMKALRQGEAQSLAVAGEVVKAVFNIKGAADQRERDAVKLADDQKLDEMAIERQGDTDYADHRKTFDKQYTDYFTPIVENSRSGNRSTLQAYFQSQLSSQGTKVEVDAFLRLAREERANSARITQLSVDRELDAGAGDGPEEVRDQWEQNLDILDANGQLAKTGIWSRDGRNRTRVMMKGQTIAQRFPGVAIELLRDKSNMVNSDIFTAEEVALLDSADMAQLRKGARDASRQQEANNVTQEKIAMNEAVIEHNTDMFSENTSPDLRDKIRLDSRLDEFPDERQKLLDRFDKNIKTQIDNAKRIATPDELLLSEEKFNNLRDSGDIDGARDYLGTITWMRPSGTQNSQMLNSLDEVEEVNKDPILTDALSLSNRTTQDVKGLIDDTKTSELTSAQISKLKLEAELNGARRNQELRTWFKNNPGATAAQKQNQRDAIMQPAQEKAAKKATESIWRRLWAGLSGQPWAIGVVGDKPPDSGIPIGRTIINPTTGERRKWDGSKWVTQ